MNIASQNNVSPRHILILFALTIALLIMMSQSPQRHFNIINVNVGEAKALIESGALVIDVREKKQFDYRHIPGAILIPVAVLRSGIPASIAYAKDKPIVVYCGDGVTHGPEGTELLNKAGFKKAVNIQRGIEGWAGAGLPVKK